MIQIFLDTNIWFDYCWAKYSKKKPRGKTYVPINRINSFKGKIILTDVLMYEIASLFKERFLVKYVMDQGISAYEIRRIKRDFSLGRSERKKVDDIFLNHIQPLSVVKDQWLYDWLDQDVLDEVFRITSTHDIEFIDCLHIISALIANCEVFVTRDEALREGFRKASGRYKSLRKLKVLKPEEFLNNYSKLVFKK